MTDMTCAPCIKIRLEEIDKKLAEMAPSVNTLQDLELGPKYVELLYERRALDAAYRQLRPVST